MFGSWGKKRANASSKCARRLAVEGGGLQAPH
jgi:hypothetical protein